MLDMRNLHITVSIFFYIKRNVDVINYKHRKGKNIMLLFNSSDVEGIYSTKRPMHSKRILSCIIILTVKWKRLKKLYVSFAAVLLLLALNIIPNNFI
jgi:hypothetical protein